MQFVVKSSPSLHQVRLAFGANFTSFCLFLAKKKAEELEEQGAD
jgi:hypothetical protein